MGIFEGFGLIDLIFLILCLRISYTAVSSGIFAEILKILALFVSSIFAFQFYPFITENLGRKVLFFNQDFLKIIIFSSLFFITLTILSLLVKITNTLLKRKEIIFAEKLLALFFGLLRFGFLASIIIFLLYLLPAKPAFCSGRSLRIFKNIAPKTYLVTIGIYNKFNPALTVNAEVKKIYETEVDLPGDNQKGN